MRIRSDLVGVVYVEGLVLRAGDTIPDGVTVGDHLLEPDGTDAPEPEGEAADAEQTPVPVPEPVVMLEPEVEVVPEPEAKPAPKPKPHTKG